MGPAIPPVAKVMTLRSNIAHRNVPKTSKPPHPHQLVEVTPLESVIIGEGQAEVPSI